MSRLEALYYRQQIVKMERFMHFVKALGACIVKPCLYNIAVHALQYYFTYSPLRSII